MERHKLGDMLTTRLGARAAGALADKFGRGIMEETLWVTIRSQGGGTFPFWVHKRRFVTTSLASARTIEDFGKFVRHVKRNFPKDKHLHHILDYEPSFESVAALLNILTMPVRYAPASSIAGMCGTIKELHHHITTRTTGLSFYHLPPIVTTVQGMLEHILKVVTTHGPPSVTREVARVCHNFRPEETLRLRRAAAGVRGPVAQALGDLLRVLETIHATVDFTEEWTDFAAALISEAYDAAIEPTLPPTRPSKRPHHPPPRRSKRLRLKNS
jgi:hypothetical protein